MFTIKTRIRNHEHDEYCSLQEVKHKYDLWCWHLNNEAFLVSRIYKDRSGMIILKDNY